MVTLQYIMAIYNDMFDRMDGVMLSFAMKITQMKEDILFAVKFAWQKLFQYHAEVTPVMGMLLILTHIIDPFQKLWSFRMWDNGMDISPEDGTFHTTQYQVAFLKFVEYEYYAKHRRLHVKTRNHTE